VWVLLARLLIDDSALMANLHSISVVALVGRHEFDAAMAVPAVTFRKVVTLGLLFKQPEPMVSPVPTEALLVVC
jgi:hypothetical protein